MRKYLCASKYKSIQTILHQFHPLRNTDNLLAPRLTLPQTCCSVQCIHNIFTKPRVLLIVQLSYSTLELKTHHSAQMRSSRCSGQKHNWICIAAVKEFCCHASHCASTSVWAQGTGLTWMKKLTLQWVLVFRVMQFVCIQPETPRHLSI